MKTLLFPLFTLLILASCTVDTVSQDELLQQELLSLGDTSKSSNKSGSYEDDDDSYEDENSDNESNESEEENESNEDSGNDDESEAENDTDSADNSDSSSNSSEENNSSNESNENSSSDNDSSDDDSSNESDSDSSQNTQGFSATVLSNIQTYVNTNHSGQTIIKMEQETNYIEVDLSNGIEIYFDNNGNFMRYDN
jgi:hypothetical protein